MQLTAAHSESLSSAAVIGLRGRAGGGLPGGAGRVGVAVQGGPWGGCRQVVRSVAYKSKDPALQTSRFPTLCQVLETTSEDLISTSLLI